MANHTIDITNEKCPMTFVKVKLKLNQIEKGDVLEILLTGGEPLENIPRSSEEAGHKVLSTVEEGGFYKLTIEK